MPKIPKELMSGHNKRLKRLAKAKTQSERAGIIMEGQRTLNAFENRKK